MDDNGHVTLDPQKIAGLSLSNLSADDIRQLILEQGDAVADEIEADDATLTLGALGGTYQVGPIDINVALGNIVLLHEINSPLITGDLGEEGDPLDSVECVKALYVLAHGREAIRPIMAMKQRIQAVMMLKPMVEKNPALFDKLMDRVEYMSEAEARFSEKAMDWYDETFVGYEFQEIVDSMFVALNDMVKMSGDLPSDTGEKKKVRATFDYEWALSLAFMVATETNEKIDSLLWEVSCLTVFKMVSLCYSVKTGKPVMNHKEKRMAKAQSELVERLQHGK